MPTDSSQSQRRIARRRLGATPPRWLVLLLIVALATSGFLHALENDHPAAADHWHETVAMSADDSDAPCSHEQGSQPDEAACTTMSGCSIFMPIAGLADLTLPGAVSVRPVLETVASSRIQSPDIHPPKLLQHV